MARAERKPRPPRPPVAEQKERRRRKARSKRGAAAAAKKIGETDNNDLATSADERLGRVVDAKPAGRRPDGSPIAGPDQAYVFTTGAVFHPVGCRTVGEAFENGLHVRVTTARSCRV